uniref:Uncharacterized protein n=1 Tax=Tanacetum cinerariifolium TaxID=118510 RepID=A0A6L2LUM8_TANCI|nr:hypothetical protein [Tanacetum cinerariifolium]
MPSSINFQLAVSETKKVQFIAIFTIRKVLIIRINRLQDDIRVTAAQVYVNAVKLNLVLFRSQIPDNSKKGFGYESYHAVPPLLIGLFLPPKLDLSNSGFEEFQQPQFEGYRPKTSKSVCEDISNEVKEYLDAPLVKDRVSDNKDAQPRPVNTARPNSAVVNAVKASSYLKEFNGGYVTFGGEANGLDCVSWIFTNIYRISKAVWLDLGKNFSGKVTPLFENMMVQPQEDIDEHKTTTANDPLLNGEDRLKLTELIELFTQLQSRILVLETTKANQALEIRSLKIRLKNLEKKASKKTHKLKRLYKIDMFDTSILNDEEVVVEKEVSTTDPVHTAGELVTTAGVKTSKPKAKGIVMQEPSETPTLTPIDSFQQLLRAKDKGKAKMIEPKKPLKKKDHIMIDEEVARNLEAQMQAELEEEDKLARQNEKEANIALIKSWDNTSYDGCRL